MPSLPDLKNRLPRLLLLTLCAAQFALHFVHLQADFPNFSPWMDWSKYTDEGWYVPGDFNPAAALPVWPFLEAILFRFTGVSLVAARALTVSIFGGILIFSYLLVRRWSVRRESLAAEGAVLLLVASPFCYVFTRLAILEPLLILLTLLLLLVVSSVRCRETDNRRQGLSADIVRNAGQILAISLLLPLLILTKTTGIFLLPSVAFLLWATLNYRLRTFFLVGLPAAIVGGGLWLLYFEAVVRPHYLLDYRYLFSANGYTRITLSTAGTVLANTFTDGVWIGPALYTCAVCCAVVSVLLAKRLRSQPLIPALLLWAIGYEAFLAYHNNLQPRYYLVVAVPLTLLIPVTIEQLVLPLISNLTVRKTLAITAMAALGGIAVRESIKMVHYVQHPEYTLVHAAHEVQEVVDSHERQDPKHNPLVLSISGSDLSLITGIRSICDDFGTLELVDKVRQYKPGWYVAWNQIDDDKMDALTPYYHIERVAAFPAMDDPDRNLLIVYRLDDSLETPPTRRHRKPPPRALLTKVGQQPSTSQLEH